MESVGYFNWFDLQIYLGPATERYRERGPGWDSCYTITTSSDCLSALPRRPVDDNSSRFIHDYTVHRTFIWSTAPPSAPLIDLRNTNPPPTSNNHTLSQTPTPSHNVFRLTPPHRPLHPFPPTTTPRHNRRRRLRPHPHPNPHLHPPLPLLRPQLSRPPLPTSHKG